MTYVDGWRNRIHQIYTQYCDLDQCNPKLLQLLLKYGSAFDDYWFYAIRGRSRRVVIRRPLWMGSTEESGRFAEKPKAAGRRIEYQPLSKFFLADADGGGNVSKC